MPLNFEPRHLRLMRRALNLARRGAGRTSPNPMVGCVIARGDEIVGEGWHLFEDRDHAEVVALGRAGARAKGADLYVTLEPCCHQGRTPPCVERILKAGVKRVFVAVGDPNPLVLGKGMRRLREGGVEVREGLLATRAALLNEAFFHFIRHGRPFVLLKLALTLDGRIATGAGDSHWITGQAARRDVHRLRFQSDAILVGVRTVLKDDPSLDVRGRRRNSIIKVVLDSRLRTPPTAKLFASGDPVVVFHAPDPSEYSTARLGGLARLLESPVTRDGGLDWDAVLGRLGEADVTSLIVEGGAQIAASALRAGAVQKVRFYYGPKIIGDSGIAGVGPLPVNSLSQAIALRDLTVRRFGPDIRIEGYPVAP